MTPSPLRADIVADRVGWIRRMLEGLRSLPLQTPAAFEADARNAAAESSLRRALEALLDLGRHVLAKGFGRIADCAV